MKQLSFLEAIPLFLPIFSAAVATILTYLLTRKYIETRSDIETEKSQQEIEILKYKIAELDGKIIEVSDSSNHAGITIDSSIPFWSSLDSKAKVEIIIVDENEKISSYQMNIGDSKQVSLNINIDYKINIRLQNIPNVFKTAFGNYSREINIKLSKNEIIRILYQIPEVPWEEAKLVKTPTIEINQFDFYKNENKGDFFLPN